MEQPQGHSVAKGGEPRSADKLTDKMSIVCNMILATAMLPLWLVNKRPPLTGNTPALPAAAPQLNQIQ